MTDDEKITYDEMLERIPAGARQDAAMGRNAVIRMRDSREKMLQDSAIVKAKARTLHHKWRLNPNQIGVLFSMSRTRVLQILGKK